jgi:protein transport protein SEC24
MAAPHDGYPPADPYGQPKYNEHPQQPGIANAASPPLPAGEQHFEGGKKKKRGYAAQAYDFGAGANSALGNQPLAGGASPQGQAPAYGGYPAQPEAQQGYGAPSPYLAQGVPAPSYGQSAALGLGGYQAPDTGYPSPGVPPASVGGITQGIGQMGLGGPGQATAQPQAAATRSMALNQLYPTDLLNQPFNVAELELPPPPIILPPNVSMCFTYERLVLILYHSPA